MRISSPGRLSTAIARLGNHFSRYGLTGNRAVPVPLRPHTTIHAGATGTTRSIPVRRQPAGYGFDSRKEKGAMLFILGMDRLMDGETRKTELFSTAKVASRPDTATASKAHESNSAKCITLLINGLRFQPRFKSNIRLTLVGIGRQTRLKRRSARVKSGGTPFRRAPKTAELPP